MQKFFNDNEQETSGECKKKKSGIWKKHKGNKNIPKYAGKPEFSGESD